MGAQRTRTINKIKHILAKHNLSQECPTKGLKAIKTDVDRSTGVPATTSFPPLVFPKLERATLSNGLKLVLAERPGLPIVQMSLEVAGARFSSDPAKAQGTASFTMASDSRSWMSAALTSMRDDPAGVTSYTDASTPPFLPFSS